MGGLCVNCSFASDTQNGRSTSGPLSCHCDGNHIHLLSPLCYPSVPAATDLQTDAGVSLT